MTLHDAIQQALRQNGQPMTSAEIADAINQQKLYTRGDGNPVRASQISARINHYLNIFLKVGGKIGLI